MSNWNRYKPVLNSINVNTIDVPDDLYEYTKALASKTKEEALPMNGSLAGLIKEEFRVNDMSKDLFYFLRKGLDKKPFHNLWSGIDINTKDLPIALGESWINYQKKYEFNPLHDHSGFASYILFIQIPYDLNKEATVFPKANNSEADTNPNSKLVFVGHNVTKGNIESVSIPVDKSFEGKLLMFDAHHYHMVYPFYTSDDYRITMSGNFKFHVD